MILEQVNVADITEEDIKWLTVGCMRCAWDGDMSAAKLVKRALAGDVLIYRIHGREKGIVVLVIDRDKDQLWIELIAGRGLMRGNLHEVLIMMARDLGLKKVAGLVSSSAMAKWYDRHTAGRPVATLYVEEVV